MLYCLIRWSGEQVQRLEPYVQHHMDLIVNQLLEPSVNLSVTTSVYLLLLRVRSPVSSSVIMSWYGVECVCMC